MNKVLNYIKRLVQISVVLFGFTFCSSMIVLFCEVVYSSILGSTIDATISDSNGFTLQAIGQFISIIALYFIFKSYDSSLLKYCNFNKLNKKQILDTVILSLGSKLFIGILTIIIFSAFFSQFGTEASDSIVQSIKMSFGNILAGVIIIPIYEEIVFRGICMEFLRKRVGIIATILTQAIIFGIYHGNMYQFTNASLVGILFGLLVLYTDSIYASIIGHIIYNGTTMLLSVFPENSFIYNGTTGILAISSIILAFFIIKNIQNIKTFIKSSHNTSNI